MGKVFIQESTLTSIADSIRSKKGTTALIDPANMATEIASITTGGGGLPEEAFTISGNCERRFASNGWNWFIEGYGDQVTTVDISTCAYMFNNSTYLSSIPFDINTQTLQLQYAFAGCNNLTSAPRVNLTDTTALTVNNTKFEHLFGGCYQMRNADNFILSDNLTCLSNLKLTSAYSTPHYQGVFDSCYSLRTVPDWYKQLRISEESTAYSSYTYCPYNGGFLECFSLDEVTDLQVLRCTGAQTSNMFLKAFEKCCRLKNMTFETQADGTPYTVSWKAQIIDLSKEVGYAAVVSPITGNNSGITADKQVTDDATYQALKNDPDWFTKDRAYSRYNHDSAVATINSLPDTSAYLATAGGTNTIKFKGASGSATDGGAINTLTEEEIAVATAKGWTVSLV